MMKLALLFVFYLCSAYSLQIHVNRKHIRSSQLHVIGFGKNYEPKWVKKETIDGVDLDDNAKGLIGDIPVIFKQGNVTRRTMALAGQPLSDVAIQANQFIRYSCKKGECGTCECSMDGKWIRPCIETIPSSWKKGEELIIQVKELKKKAKSSGKFYSFRSFVMGFYNNAIGMIGFVKTRREARQNWKDRMEYEELIRQKILARKGSQDQSGLQP
jgi:ferredoxin